ncbi:MAG: ABC transporter permease [Flavobacteriaceae bacterium]|jgi:putative ABC transport system permease protein|nr:ABC transporter permease [Flavobacteriaceae bacterium]
MFDIDRWQEIFSSIRNNVLRTVLSGFTVALGLFIFIVLFGIGKGLQNSFNKSFRGDANNLIYIFTGKTSIAYDGLQANRQISLQNKDYESAEKKYSEKIEYSSPRYQFNMLVKYGKESGNYRIIGVYPDEQFIEQRNLMEGRYISPNDFRDNKKVAVIGRMVQKDLIKSGTSIGKYIDIDGTMFRIVGVFSDPGGDRDERVITIALPTLQLLKKNSDTLSQMMVAYDQNMSPDEAIKLGENIKTDIKKRHRVSPDDEGGVMLFNNAENTKEQFAFMAVLALIVLVIGLGTLVAGIIGISNIMVYIVKERTKEIGVRKAIGAKPASIVALILQESVIITIISGLVGVGLAVLTINLIGNSLEEYFIIDPNVGWFEIISAFITLVFAGTLAGFVPAYRASKIKPIEALRDE